MVLSPPRAVASPAPALRSALRSLVRDIGADYPADVRSGDLGRKQTVAAYSRSLDAMRRYTHMYAGKHVAAWAALRARLHWGDLCDRPLVSLGAGPMLCLAGWLHDHGPHPDARAIDPLDWRPVTGTRGGQALQAALGHPRVHRGVYAPMDAAAPPVQLAHLRGMRSLLPDDIPTGSVVLMPMMLNHLLDRGEIPAATWVRLVGMFAHLRETGCRIVIADLWDRKSTRLWAELCLAAGARGGPAALCFPLRLAQQRDLYRADHADYRTSARMARLNVLVWDGARWLGEL